MGRKVYLNIDMNGKTSRRAGNSSGTHLNLLHAQSDVRGTRRDIPTGIGSYMVVGVHPDTGLISETITAALEGEHMK